MKTVVLASGNPGKIAELRRATAALGWQWQAQNELGIADPAETGLTFVENALIKARNASKRSGLPALADDSGLCIDALDGAPGLDSATYSGKHGDSAGHIAKVLQELADVPRAERGARFMSVIVYVRSATDPLPIIAQGEWPGEILDAPRGEGGFGYDPIFFDPSVGLSAAELDPADKDKLSHRGRALANFMLQLAARQP